MPITFAWAALTRWLTLSALAALIGAFVLDVVVLPRGSPELVAVRRRLGRWRAICVVVLILASASELLARTTEMSGGTGSFLAAVPAVLKVTHFGKIWIARSAALGLLLLLSFSASGAARSAGLVLAVGTALTASLTGHAADRGDLTLSVFLDWTHVLTASAWAGGLIGLALVVLRGTPDLAAGALAAVARRFSRLGGLCLLAVVGSGVYNAWIQLSAVSDLWTTGYGRVLSLKLVAVLTAAGLAAVNRWDILPRLGPGRPAGGIGFRLCRLARLAILGGSRVPKSAIPSKLSAYVRGEAWAVVVVLGLTGILGQSTPARHASHAQHLAHAGAERGPFRVTMSELHEAGGVPKGWIFVPPPGDPARGRELFVQLECFACHTVRGEGFPPPSGPGPDLTGMGEHHPAGYLAESIMNPNAVIVEGPGYAGDDGLSVMPYYGDDLTVTQLADLVAYLRSLHEDAH